MLFRLLLAALFLPVAWGIHISHLDLREKLVVKSDANQEALLLPPQFLQILSFGFDSLLADTLWLQMIQYYGAAHQQSISHTHLYSYFDTITTLDPDFEAGYIFSSYLLADDRKEVSQALKLLEKGELNMPKSWMIPFQEGFLYYIQLKDNLKAAQAFQRSASKPNSPEINSRLAAQLFKKSNESEGCQLSLRLWMDALEKAPSADLKTRAERHVAETRIFCDLIELRKALKNYAASQNKNWQQAVAEAKAKHIRQPLPAPATTPASLQDLVSAGLLTQVPSDPFGRPYVYRQEGQKIMSQPLPWKPVDLTPADVIQTK